MRRGHGRDTERDDTRRHWSAFCFLQEEYMRGAERQTTINHFYEKLLTLKERMTTEAGRRMAEGRHRFMEAFLEQFFAEWQGKR